MPCYLPPGLDPNPSGPIAANLAHEMYAVKYIAYKNKR
jgi:hypothetical protein